MSKYSTKRILEISNIGKNYPCLFNFEILNSEESSIVNKIISGYSFQDVANDLKLSKSTVYRKYNNAIKKLKTENEK